MQTENPISAEIVFTSLNLGMYYTTYVLIFATEWDSFLVFVEGFFSMKQKFREVFLSFLLYDEYIVVRFLPLVIDHNPGFKSYPG